MMKNQRTKGDVVIVRGLPFQNVCCMIGNFRIIGAQAPGDFQCGRLLIDCIDRDLRANPSSEIDEQPRNIARTGGEIDNSHLRAGHYPAPHESETRR